MREDIFGRAKNQRFQPFLSPQIPRATTYPKVSQPAKYQTIMIIVSATIIFALVMTILFLAVFISKVVFQQKSKTHYEVTSGDIPRKLGKKT